MCNVYGYRNAIEKYGEEEAADWIDFEVTIINRVFIKI